MSSQERFLPKVRRLAREQGDRCAYCREPFGAFEQEANATLDHVVPACRGGKRVDANLVAACARCNHVKGRMDVEAFCALIDEGRLRPRRNLTASRKKLRDSAAEKAVPRQPVRVGAPGAPHSKNPPLKRLYTMDDARRWEDEDRYARRPSDRP